MNPRHCRPALISGQIKAGSATLLAQKDAISSNVTRLGSIDFEARAGKALRSCE